MSVSAPDYSPELAGRLAKLESAISKQRTVKFGYWSPRLTRPTERTMNPYALRLDDGNWYVVGHDLDRGTARTYKVSRIRGDIRFATRRERDFRVPADFDVEAHRVPRPWQIGDTVGRARISVSEDTAWWVERTLADAGTVEDDEFETDVSNIELLAGWVLRQNGRAVPLEPYELVEAVANGLARIAEAHTTIVITANVGFMLAGRAILLIEYIEDTDKTIDDVNRSLQIPVIGYIPKNNSEDFSTYVAQQPLSPIADAFRTLRTNLEYTSVDQSIRTIMNLKF